MKLNKGKIGSSLIAFFALVVLFTLSTAVFADEYTLNKNEFEELTGDYLSNGTVEGEEIKTGDTLLLDFEEVIQKQPLLIDVEGIKIKPVSTYDTVTLEQNWSGSPTPPPPPGTVSAANAVDDSIYNLVDASFVVFKGGVSLDSLEFKPRNPPGEDVGPANAIEVDFFNTDATKNLTFHNIKIPVAGSSGGFINGIKFDGDVAGILGIGGEEGMDYDGDMVLKDIRFEGENGAGIKGNGIVFTDNVGKVSNLDLEEIYAGYIESYPGGYSPWGDNTNPGSTNPQKYSGNGIVFNNTGYVKNVSFTKSERTSPSVSELEYTLEENSGHGVVVNGAKVSEVNGLVFNYVRIEDNKKAGIFISGSNSTDHLDTIGMTVKNALITGNDYGILVADKYESPAYSRVKIEGVQLGNNLTVYNNVKGGALFKVQVVNGTKSSPALTIESSQFDKEAGDTEPKKNLQDFGLIVDAFEGINGVKITDSTFHYHGIGTDTLSGAGIELRTPMGESESSDDYFDPVRGVSIKNSSAEYNSGEGLLIGANVVENVDITTTDSSRGKFSENGQNGIFIVGTARVTGLTLKGEDGKELMANGNDEYGLLVKSNGKIEDLSAENAKFGTAENSDNGNGMSGVKLVTYESGDIGSTDSKNAITFKNIIASGNGEEGLEVDSAGSFLNPSSSIFLNNSEIKENNKSGLHLEAYSSVKNLQVENSSLVGNNLIAGHAGVYVKAENEMVKGTDIVANVLADNKIGIAIDESPEDIASEGSSSALIETIKDLTIKGNTTEHPEESDRNGNHLANIALVGKNLNNIEVKENILTSAYSGIDYGKDTDIGLLLKSQDSSTDVSVRSNKLKSGAKGNCLGVGTAIVLDAKDTKIKKNQIEGYGTAISVLKEASGSKKASDTSSHINENNILGCCVTIDASALSFTNGEKVNATNNYWGEDATKDSISREANMKTDSSNPLDQVFVEPLKDNPVSVMKELSIDEFQLITTEPKVGESAELEYELLNSTSSEFSVNEVLITITDPSGTTVVDNKQIESNFTIAADSLHTNTYQFTPQSKGTYTAELSIDGTFTKSINFDIGTGVAPKDKKPYFGQDGDRSTSGILPAPIDGDDTPKLELKNKDGNSIASAVDTVKMMVFDLSGQKLWSSKDVNMDNLSALEKLQNGLYLYTLTVEVCEDTYKSPVMKFIVKQ